MKTSNLTHLSTAAALALAALIPSVASAAITGPYTADANTIYLYHLDEVFGASAAANSGSAGFSAYAYKTAVYPGDNVGAPVDTTVLGAVGYTGFGNAASITNINQGLGVDTLGNGSFQLDDNTPTPATATDRLANHTSILGAGNVFTLEAMINLPSIGAGTREIICTDSAGTSRGFQFRVNASNLEFNWIGSVPAGFTMAIPTIGANAFAANEWFHVALSYDGVNNNVYWTRVDPANTTANLLGVNSVETPNSASAMLLDLGNEGRSSGVSLGSSEGLLGMLDEVRISNISRTAGQFIFVPEPATGALLGLGALALGLSRRRRA